MTEMNDYAATIDQPTIIETELDSISLQLNRMKAQVQRVHILQHITDSERARLDEALSRAMAKMTELSESIRGSD